MKNTKRNFNKFSSRREARERSRRELLKIAEELNVGTSAARVRFTEERNFHGRARKQIIAEGRFSETASGYGFVHIDDNVRDIFIPEGKCSDALDGDTVKISYSVFTSSYGEEKTEGRVLEVLEYGRRNVVGTVETEIQLIHKRCVERLFIIPDDGKIKRRIYIRDGGDVERGNKVLAKLVRGSNSYCLEADVISNFGNTFSKNANYMAILAECDISTEFTEEELKQAEVAARMPLSREGRVVRDEIIFTIDSESAKDLDDAVSLKILDTGYELGVHIADVSVYVNEKTALDRLVMARGTSVYFTDKVVPMLPVSLSNGACSLSPGTEKYTLSAIITLDENGTITDTRIEPSIINSRVKGIYSEINALFSGTASTQIKEKYRECLESLLNMRELYCILLKKSRARGALELENAEAEIILDENGNPSDIIRRTRGDAEKMIEQFMLTANEAVATLLKNANIPCVYRVHDAPPEDKLESFITYAHNLGFDTSFISRKKCSSADLGRLIEEANIRGIGEAVSYACLRAMSKAEYSEINKPHFGLGIEKYCHFTSPIRRLSDLATHRIIHKVILEGKPAEKYKSYARRAAAAATDGELRAIAAERRIENLYKVIYMSDKIGEVFPATVNSVTSFGLFATMDNTCEGLIPISELGGDFIYDEQNLTLRSTREILRTGQRIMIKVEEADILRGKLRFSLVSSEVGVE